MADAEMAELMVRVAELERQIVEERADIKPLLDFWNAGKLIGKGMVIFGGMIVGAVTVWKSISEWVMAHIR